MIDLTIDEMSAINYAFLFRPVCVWSVKWKLFESMKSFIMIIIIIKFTDAYNLVIGFQTLVCLSRRYRSSS